MASAASQQSARQAKIAFAKSFERRSYADKERYLAMQDLDYCQADDGHIDEDSDGSEGCGVPGSALCDTMTGWHTECLASTAERCEVFVDRFVGSCDAFCRRQVSWSQCSLSFFLHIVYGSTVPVPVPPISLHIIENYFAPSWFLLLIFSIYFCCCCWARVYPAPTAMTTRAKGTAFGPRREAIVAEEKMGAFLRLESLSFTD